MPLVEVDGLTKHFTRSRGWMQAPMVTPAVDNVSFAIDEG